MKNKSVIVVFLLILCSLSIVNLLLPDKAVSESERRRLAQRPELSAEQLLSGKAMTAFDKYAMDQFVGREFFRGIKVLTEQHILGKSDTNGLFEASGGIYKIEYPLNEEKVKTLCEKLTALCARYFTEQRVYYAIVPDKNYYLPGDGKYLLMDYPKLTALMAEHMPKNAQYINLFGTLTTANYYKSDGHWRQETLQPVIGRLYEAMDIPVAVDLSQYAVHGYTPFYGAYYGQLVGMAPPDTLYWLESEEIANTAVHALGNGGMAQVPVYFEDGLSGMDAYDLFLHGAQPLLVLENKRDTSGRELIIFRDSFGSSLAPLLLPGYAKITLVDLRYITRELLGDYIDFEKQDILFLYSTTIINNSDIIR